MLLGQVIEAGLGYDDGLLDRPMASGIPTSSLSSGSSSETASRAQCYGRPGIEAGAAVSVVVFGQRAAVSLCPCCAPAPISHFLPPSPGGRGRIARA